jgi:photosystem II stability/assembly factor-like uncharacterized protein
MPKMKSIRSIKTWFLIITLISLISCNFLQPSLQAKASASEALRWTKVSIPTEGEAGKWGLASGSDVKQVAISGDGTLYAAVTGLTYTLFRSTDGGYSWEHPGNVRDDITGIAISPHDNNIVYYATASAVYKSTNGGKTFTSLAPHPGGAGTDHREIASIDIARLNGDIIVVGIRDNDINEFGGVYILDETDTIPEWADTGIGSYDVCAVACSPDFPNDRRIVAVATDENNTHIASKTGDTGWNAAIGCARLDVVATSAEIALPGGDNGDVEEFVGYVAIATGTGGGDVFKIEGNPAPDMSLATDLNAGSAGGQSDIDITGLAAYRNESGVTLLAGAADSTITYITTDEGKKWTRCRKAPTGTGHTGVRLAPDFEVSGKMYAFTSGDGSALSVSRDSGETWNQVSLIDTTIETIVDLAPSPAYSQDDTLFMLTFGNGPSTGGLWRSRDGGDTWERTLTSQSDIVGSLRKVALPPEYGGACQKVFVGGESRGNPAIWESTDGGQNYRRRLLRDPDTGGGINIDAWAVADNMTFYIGSYDGSQGIIYLTHDGGLSFTEGMPVGSQPLYSLALSPDHARDGAILAGDANGNVYWMDDHSTSFQSLPGDATAPPFSGPVNVAFDPGYVKNRTVYAAGNFPDEGVYRFVIGESTEWENIDDTLPAGAMLNGLTAAGDGTFYAVDSAADGGMERGLDPSSGTGPTFETITGGLNDGATLFGLWQAGHRIWSVDTANTRLMTFDDTLTEPVRLVSPEPGAAGAGNLVDHTVRNINLDWETTEGATDYQWECGYSDDFSDQPGEFGDSTSASSVRLPALDPATTYHWRVRASRPALSPWSEKRSFTTAMDTEGITLRPESPTAGAAGVPRQPVFQWTAVLGADAYELSVFSDAELTDMVIVMTGENAIPGNVWSCNTSLDYATTYYWRVRAVNASTYSAWSTTGVFTTEMAPEATENTGPPTGQVASIAPENTGTIKPLAASSTPAAQEPPAPPPATNINGGLVPTFGHPVEVSAWIIYFIGGLLTIVILALLVVLVIVLKIRRIT